MAVLRSMTFGVEAVALDTPESIWSNRRAASSGGPVGSIRPLGMRKPAPIVTEWL
jgi:hypothetical protein